MNKFFIQVSIALGLLIGVLLITQPVIGKSKLSAYNDLCEVLNDITGDSIAYHYIIYINLESCLTCSESMEWWHKLEREIPECGGSFTIWSSRKDSLDVAEAMRLECFTTPVRVMEPEVLKALKLQGVATPLKLLIKKNCEPLMVKSPATKKAPQDFEKEVLKLICDGNKEEN